MRRRPPGARDLLRERQGSARSAGSVSAGQSRIQRSSFGHVSNADPEGDCRASVPLAFQRSPPFPLRGSGGPAGRRDPFGGLREVGRFGSLRDPTGFFGTLAEFHRLCGNLGVAVRSFGTKWRTGGYLGNLRVSANAPGRFRPGPSGPDGSFDGAPETVPAVKPAFPPWSERRWSQRPPGGADRARVAVLRGLPFGVRREVPPSTPPPIRGPSGPCAGQVADVKTPAAFVCRSPHRLHEASGSCPSRAPPREQSLEPGASFIMGARRVGQQNYLDVGPLLAAARHQHRVVEVEHHRRVVLAVGVPIGKVGTGAVLGC